MTKKYTRWSLEKVKDYIEKESNGNCNLLSTVYKNYNSPLKIKCGCGNIFNISIAKFKVKEKMCNECSTKQRGRRSRKTHEEFVKKVYDLVGDEYIVTGRYTVADEKLTFYHDVCGQEFLMRARNFVTTGSRCPICASQSVNESNCFATTSPENANFLVKISDGYKITHKSNKVLKFYCPRCENIVNSSPKNVMRMGISCNKCSDGVSYPEKFMFNVLDQLDVEFETQKSFKWAQDKYYDFYLPQLKCIIETHGMQHYRKDFSFVSLEETIENDNLKKKLVEDNSDYNYIVVDCRYSTKGFIKQSIIKSELVNLLDLSKIDWEECDYYSTSSYIILAVDLWNKGVSIDDIADKIKRSTASVRNYLKKGKENGWNSYPDRQRL